MSPAHTRTVAAGAFLICALAWLGPALNDADGERTAKAKRDAEVQAMVDHRVERAARAVCAEQFGLGAVPVWISDTTLQCYPALSAPVAMGGRP